MNANSTERGGPPGDFPYAKLLAFVLGEGFDPTIEAILRDPHHADHRRFAAHRDSVQFLELERAAAAQDAEDLGCFEPEDATPFCRAVARGDGKVFAELVAGRSTAGGFDREQWADHVDACVYCRRKRRAASARAARVRANVPADEPLLRDWLLARECPALTEELKRVTELFRQPERQPAEPGRIEVPQPSPNPFDGLEGFTELLTATRGPGIPRVPVGEVLNWTKSSTATGPNAPADVWRATRLGLPLEQVPDQLPAGAPLPVNYSLEIQLLPLSSGAVTPHVQVAVPVVNALHPFYNWLNGRQVAVAWEAPDGGTNVTESDRLVLHGETRETVAIPVPGLSVTTDELARTRFEVRYVPDDGG